jgi:hypothetical protein
MREDPPAPGHRAQCGMVGIILACSRTFDRKRGEMSNLPNGKPILCLDFDGVIHSYTSGWKGPRSIPDEAVPGAIEFISNCLGHFQVCIYSSRSRYLFGRRAMRKWLFDKLLDYIFDKYPQSLDAPFIDESSGYGAAKSMLYEIKFPIKKPAAFLQIDDRAICFNGTFPNLDEIKAFKPWNKR